MTHSQLMRRLNAMLEEAGSQRQLALSLGIATSTVSRVLAGKEQPPPQLLAALGLKRVVHYVPSGP